MPGTRILKAAALFVAATSLALISGCTPGPSGTGSGSGSCPRIVEVPLDGSRATMSADGHRLAFLRDGRIIVRNTVNDSDLDITGSLAVGLPLASLRMGSDGTHVGVTLPGIDRPDRSAYIIDIDSAAANHVVWDEPPWTFSAQGRGFSDDLSAFLFQEGHTSNFWVTPMDGSPGYPVTLPGQFATHMSSDGSAIASGPNVWRAGALLSYPGPDSSSAQVVDLDNSGSRALVGTDSGYYFWHLDSGDVEPLLSAVAEVPEAPNWAAASDDGRFVVREITTTDGNYGVWRIDQSMGHFTPLPPVFDGVTGISSDGRVITSTNGSYFRCTN